jgi:hypothetical protein
MKNEKMNGADMRLNFAQKSKAIYQHTIKQPIGQIKPLVRKIGRSMDIARSKSINHFEPRKIIAPARPIQEPKQFNVGQQRHPMTVATIAPKAIVDTTPVVTKEAAIAEAFSKLSDEQKRSRENFKRKSKLFNIILATVTAILIILYFVLTNSNILVSIASAQTGINASFPEYKPEGFDRSGPITSTDNQVGISFISSSSKKQFSLVQKKSSWDSSAVKDKVSQDSNGEFITTEDSGLTIYSHNGNASWVNGGILYTISGDAQLSTDQIRRIAASL